LEEIDIEVEDAAPNVSVTSLLIDPYENFPSSFRPPLPNENDPNFTPEKKLKGIQLYKAMLADLFSSIGSLPNIQYITALSAADMPGHMPDVNLVGRTFRLEKLP
jgi:hypothetical protein